MSDGVSALVLDPGTRARFQQLRVLAGRDVLDELVTLFAQDVPRQIVACQDALGRADAEALRRAAHAARGGAGALGALELAELCARIEIGATEEGPAALSDLVDALDPAFQRARTALERLDTGAV